MLSAAPVTPANPAAKALSFSMVLSGCCRGTCQLVLPRVSVRAPVTDLGSVGPTVTSISLWVRHGASGSPHDA
jgi:hypothetical protein